MSNVFQRDESVSKHKWAPVPGDMLSCAGRGWDVDGLSVFYSYELNSWGRSIADLKPHTGIQPGSCVTVLAVTKEFNLNVISGYVVDARMSDNVVVGATVLESRTGQTVMMFISKRDLIGMTSLFHKT